jgi:hypothetical protein
MVKKQYACGTFNPAPKYHNDKRKSPPYSATDCIGETMVGNDGNEWKSEYVGKSYRWVLADGSDSKNKQYKQNTHKSVHKHSRSRNQNKSHGTKRKLWNLSDIRKSHARKSSGASKSSKSRKSRTRKSRARKSPKQRKSRARKSRARKSQKQRKSRKSSSKRSRRYRTISSKLPNPQLTWKTSSVHPSEEAPSNTWGTLMQHTGEALLGQYGAGGEDVTSYRDVDQKDLDWEQYRQRQLLLREFDKLYETGADERLQQCYDKARMQCNAAHMPHLDLDTRTIRKPIVDPIAKQSQPRRTFRQQLADMVSDTGEWFGSAIGSALEADYPLYSADPRERAVVKELSPNAKKLLAQALSKFPYKGPEHVKDDLTISQLQFRDALRKYNSKMQAQADKLSADEFAQLLDVFNQTQQEQYNNALATESPEKMSILFRALSRNIAGSSQYSWVLPELSRAIESRNITVHNPTKPVKATFEQLKKEMPRLLPNYNPQVFTMSTRGGGAVGGGRGGGGGAVGGGRGGGGYGSRN